MGGEKETEIDRDGVKEKYFAANAKNLLFIHDCSMTEFLRMNNQCRMSTCHRG